MNVHREICEVIQTCIFYCHWHMVEFGYIYCHFKSWKIIHDLKISWQCKHSCQYMMISLSPLAFTISLFTHTYNAWCFVYSSGKVWGFWMFVFTSKYHVNLCHPSPPPILLLGIQWQRVHKEIWPSWPLLNPQGMNLD